MSTQQLYQGLVEDGHYTKSLQEFQSQFQAKDSQLDLYNGIVQDGDFTGSFIDFQNKFFPTQAAVTTPASTPTSTSEREEPTFVNSEFWKNQRHERGNYTHKEGRWHYTNPEDPKDVRTLTKGPVLEELQKEREAELDYKL